MNSLQVNCFLAVAKHLSFSKAAEELYLSQPAVSRYVAKLERELGFALFARNSRTVRLTDSGQEVLNLFRSAELSLNNIRANAKGNESAVNEEVTIGFLDRWDLSVWLPNTIKTLQSTHPNISLSLQSFNYRDLQAALRNQTVDIMLLSDRTIEKAEGIVATRHVTTLQHMFLYSPRCAVARIEAPSIRDFENETFLVSFDASDGVRGDINALCASNGFVPKIKTLPNHSSVMNAIMNGLGVTLADHWCRERFDSRFSFKPVDTFYSVSIAWLVDRPSAARDAVVDLITQTFESAEG